MAEKLTKIETKTAGTIIPIEDWSQPTFETRFTPLFPSASSFASPTTLVTVASPKIALLLYTFLLK